MRRLGLVITILWACLAPAGGARQAAPSPPQQPALTFRATANYVEVDAIVTDASGEVVRNLKASDFDVVEDGKPQALSVCGFVDIPVERPDPLLFKARPIEPDVVTNEKAFDGRVFMIVLDGYHVAPLRGPEVRRQAALFIDRYMGENDIAAVVAVGNADDGQEFTGNKRLLEAAVARFNGQALASATVSANQDALSKDRMQSVGNRDPGAAYDPDALSREYMAKQSIETMRRLADYMGALSGRRKALLLFSEGIGIDTLKPDDLMGASVVTAQARTDDQAAVITGMFQPPRTDSQSIRVVEQAMIAAAAKSNVSVYAIDPRGLTTGQEDAVALATGPAMNLAGSGLRDYANPMVTRDAADESRRAQDSLQTFADETGGLALINQNDADAAFRRIVADNSAYYLLGYQSPDLRHDGRFHRVSVRTTRPGLTVRTRSGYFAPSAPLPPGTKPPDAVTEMLRAPAAVGGLGLRVGAAVVKGRLLKSTVHLTVEFRGGDVPLKSSGGLFTNDIDIEYLALDMHGTSQAGGREVAHLQLKPATQADFAETGVRYVTEFELAPGRYQLRVAAREHLGGHTGSVFYDLDVPDVGARPVAMSDLLITSSRASKTPTPSGTSTIGGALPAPTTTVREFTAADTLTVAASMYDNDASPAHQDDLNVSVHTDAGAEVFQRGEDRANAGLTSATGGYVWVVSVPLTGLAPGRYVLGVELRSRLGADRAVRREVEFRVK